MGFKRVCPPRQNYIVMDPNKEKKEERRKTVRIKKSLIALYSMEASGQKEKWDQTFIKNISEEGMMITTMKAFQQNATLHFLIKFPLQPFEWKEFRGKVIDSVALKTLHDDAVSNTYITRIEFLDLKEEQKELLRVYVAWFLSKEGGKP